VSNHGVAFWGYNPSVEDMKNIVQMVIEQRILAKTAYFFGNVYSTLSLTICILRGEEMKWLSNICGLLLHPEQDKINVKKYWNEVY
jgi:hypothetical protein